MVDELDPRAERYARDWIEYMDNGRQPLPHHEVEDDDELMLDWILPQRDPELALDAFLVVLDLIPAATRFQPEPYLSYLAAGAVEDTLVYHGEQIIDRVEALAARRADFAWLLGGVWQNGLSDELYARVVACADHRW